MGRVFVHVGAPKTGTTFLQHVLWANRSALADQGALYWGQVPGDHFFAAQDLRGRYFRGHPHPRVAGAWERLAGAARDWTGPTVLISHELLSTCTPEQADRAVESLRPHEVHVVLTARDLARQIPAMWQESVKNGRVVPYRRYLQTLQRPNPIAVGRIFWRTQDAVDILERWATAVPPERIHVVTVPPRGADPSLLWQRFCTVAGLSPAPLDDNVSTHGNVSLGLAEAELLRRLNVRLGKELSWPEHEELLKGFMTRKVLSGRPGSTRTGIPAPKREWVLERSRTMVEGLRAGGYDVVGSLDDLVPEFGSEPDATPDPSADEVLDTAVDALGVLLTKHVRLSKGPPTKRLRRWARSARRRAPVGH
jgi:hypothetical protein